MNKTKTKPVIVGVSPAGPDHQVLTVSGGGGAYRKKPCEQCPWRVDNTGSFPASAFAHSARTAYDMSNHTFACHMSGPDKPAICAGFLLRGSDHNMSVRIGYMQRTIQNDFEEGDAPLFESYRAMAVANGVDPDDERLQPCRP